MKCYLEEKTFYVKSNDIYPMFYKVSNFEVYPRECIIMWNLELVAGCDEFSGDFVTKDAFSEDLYNETAVQLMMDESVEDALDSEGYAIMNTNNVCDELAIDFILQNA